MSFRRRPSGALIGDRCRSRSSPDAAPPDQGSAAVELVVLTPVIVLLFVAVVFLGRAGQSSAQVRHAADQAARAASQVSVGRMPSVAHAAVVADLSANGVSCSSTSVDTAVSADSRGAPRWVTVSVTCQVDRSGLDLLGAASRSVQASSTEVVDRYRAP